MIEISTHSTMKLFAMPAPDDRNIKMRGRRERRGKRARDRGREGGEREKWKTRRERERQRVRARDKEAEREMRRRQWTGLSRLSWRRRTSIGFAPGCWTHSWWRQGMGYRWSCLVQEP